MIELTDVRFLDDGTLATDCVYFRIGSIIQKACLQVGDQIQFNARIGSYYRQYKSYLHEINRSEMDYKLAVPTKIFKTSKVEEL